MLLSGQHHLAKAAQPKALGTLVGVSHERASSLQDTSPNLAGLCVSTQGTPLSPAAYGLLVSLT